MNEVHPYISEKEREDKKVEKKDTVTSVNSDKVGRSFTLVNKRNQARFEKEWEQLQKEWRVIVLGEQQAKKNEVVKLDPGETPQSRMRQIIAFDAK